MFCTEFVLCSIRLVFFCESHERKGNYLISALNIQAPQPAAGFSVVKRRANLTAKPDWGGPAPRRFQRSMRPLWALITGWILAVLTVVGNGLVIFLITTRLNLRNTTNWFVLSLAVVDFGVGAVYYPRLSFCSIHDATCVNDVVKIAYPIGVLFLCASVTNLCALTLDRYLAVVTPAEVCHLHDEEARGCARICGVGCGINAVCFVDFISHSFHEKRSADYCNVPPSVHYCHRFGCLRSPAVRHSPDLPRRSQKTPRWLPSWTSTTNCSAEWCSRRGNDWNRGDGVPRLLFCIMTARCCSTFSAIMPPAVSDWNICCSGDVKLSSKSRGISFL